MMRIFSDNLAMLMRYAGAGFLFALYVPAVIFLLLGEKERWKRILLIYVPLIVLACFILPPATYVYRALIGNDGANYRLLWMVPFGITIAYAGCKLFIAHRRVGLFVMAVLVIVSGRCIYRSPYISRAQNAYHLPQIMIDIIDRLREEEQGRILCAFPPEMIHQVRQYDTEILLAYGRASVEPSMHLYNTVYEMMVVPETIIMEGLDESLVSAQTDYLMRTYRKEGNVYLILHESRQIDEDPTLSGWKEIDELHDYRIFQKHVQTGDTP